MSQLLTLGNLPSGTDKAAKDFHATNSFAAWYDDTPAVRTVRKVTLKYFPCTEDEICDSGYFQGWIIAMVFTEGMKRAGRNLTGETLMKAMETIKDFDTEGICSPITFGPENRRGQKYVRVYKADVEKKVLIPITGWRRVKD